MPLVNRNPPSSKYLAPAVALLSAAALVLFVVLRPEQASHANATSTPATPAGSPPEDLKKQIANPKFPNTPTLIAALVRDWEDLDEPDQRDARIAELEAILQTADLAPLVRTLPADVLNFALGLPAFQTWLTTNPANALALLAIRPDVSETRIRPALAAWFEKDPASCSLYVRALPPGPWREQTLALTTQLALATDPANAASWATLLAPGPRQTGLLEEVTNAWGTQNPVKAAAWIARLPDDSTRERLYATLALAHAEKDPELATSWLLQSIRPGELRNQTMARLASLWSATEPALIATWLERLPEGEPRQTAMCSLINLWSLHDRSATRAWIAQMPPGPQRDEAQAHLESLPLLTPIN